MNTPEVDGEWGDGEGRGGERVGGHWAGGRWVDGERGDGVGVDGNHVDGNPVDGHRWGGKRVNGDRVEERPGGRLDALPDGQPLEQPDGWPEKRADRRSDELPDGRPEELPGGRPEELPGGRLDALPGGRTGDPVGGAGDFPASVSVLRQRRLGWRKLTFLPGFLVVLLVATWVWFQQAELDTISENALSHGQVSKALWQQVQLTVISTFFVLIIAIPLGILLTRRRFRKATPVALALANMGQATPAIGLLALLVIWLGIGRRAALIGIIAYAILPVLSNTVAGLKANDPTLLEAARGIGMSPTGVLSRVELPLAVPLILAGVRTALVLNVGTATLATFGGGGGLGVLITAGITNQRMPILVLGSILTVSLALLVDWLASLAEVLLRPRGLEAGK